jgi:hypothetical protein
MTGWLNGPASLSLRRDCKSCKFMGCETPEKAGEGGVPMERLLLSAISTSVLRAISPIRGRLAIGSLAGVGIGSESLDVGPWRGSEVASSKKADLQATRRPKKQAREG